MSKSKNTVKKSSGKESKTVYWMPPPSSEISESLSQKVTPKAIKAWLIASRGDSLASRSALRANSLRKKMIEICGLTLLQSFASYDPDSASWKTSQGCLVQGMREEFSETWPKQGIMQDGVCWELQMLGPSIIEKGCGLHVPSPNTMDWMAPKSKEALHREMTIARKGRSQPGNLRDWVGWPTPKGSPSGPDFARTNREGSGGDDLATKVARWPTPTKQDGENNGGSSQYQRKTTPLNALVKTFPTPQASMMTDADMEQARYAGNNKNRPEYRAAGKGSLNPDWVEWLMGWPIKWSSLEPIIELLWLNWSVDPADMEEPEMWPTVAACRREGITPGGYAMYGGSGGGKKYKELMNRKGAGTGPIPRVATNTKDRVNRLKAIGNGQVPLCAATAWRVLTA